MNKKEFLGSLEKHLKYLPKEDREDALNYYSEYIDDYNFAENEDISAKLGNPKDIAKNIIKECAEKHIDNSFDCFCTCYSSSCFCSLSRILEFIVYDFCYASFFGCIVCGRNSCRNFDICCRYVCSGNRTEVCIVGHRPYNCSNRRIASFTCSCNYRAYH